jgi:hypothetical protein
MRQRQAVDSGRGHAILSLPGLTRQSIVRVSGQYLRKGLANRDCLRRSNRFFPFARPVFDVLLALKCRSDGFMLFEVDQRLDAVTLCETLGQP